MCAYPSANAGTHNHRIMLLEHAEATTIRNNTVLWLWVLAFARTTGVRSVRPCTTHSAAFAVLPNIRVGAAKPQEVPSVILTSSSQGRRNVPATMSCMKV